MIRVCFVVDAPFLGGAEMYVSRLAGALDRRHFDPFVMMKSNGADPHLAAWAEDLRARDIPVLELTLRLPFVPADALRVWRQFEARSPRIVHVNLPGPYDGQMGLLLPLARAAGARTVVTEHLPMVERLWKRAAIKRIAYRSLDIAVTMTQANARFLRERQGVPAAKVRVVPNGIPASFGMIAKKGVEQRWSLGLRETHVVIVYIGNILVHKGLRRLLEAVGQASLKDRMRVLVIGNGPDEAACRQMASDRGIGEQVLFLGRRSAAETEALLAAGDMLALPSTIEGLPYVILETMASGLPAVAGRVYGIPEVIDDGVTGLLVDPMDIGDIARALDRLAADTELRRTMGRAGRARFEKFFTLDRQTRAMESIYRGLLHGAPVSGGEPT